MNNLKLKDERFESSNYTRICQINSQLHGKVETINFSKSKFYELLHITYNMRYMYYIQVIVWVYISHEYEAIHSAFSYLIPLKKLCISVLKSARR